MKKLILILLCLCLLMSAAYAESAETIIELSGEAIFVNGNSISEDTDEDIYLAYQVEVHEDVPEELEGLNNRVITIADAGIYRFSGSATDAQIAVKAGENDEVRIILDGASITCRTAPAIAVYSAKDTRTANEYAVTIELADGSASNVTGSHTEEVEEDDVKLSGAITSLVSIGFTGEGYLNVDGDNEGIEVKFGHLTFDGGNIIVESGDDPLNASEDGISVITVNDGTLHLKVRRDKGGEGDGMDSNGAIVINGGVVDSYAHPDSMDSGIDSDLDCTINGGVVLGAGNMYDEISTESGQLFMALQFAEKVDDMIVVTTTDGTLVGVSHESAGYTSFVFSLPKLVEGDYYLYLGGELEVQDGAMVYTPGTQLQHGGSLAGRMGRDGMHRMERAEAMPEPPKDMEWPDMQPPEMGKFDGRIRRPGNAAVSAEKSTIFHLAPGSTMFAGIAAVE